MKTNPNEPLNCNNGNGFWNDEYNKTHSGIGLTKREYFAAMAMQGILANSSLNMSLVDDGKIAVAAAAALIAELNKQTNKQTNRAGG